MTNPSGTAEFSKWRRRLWPVHRSENKKFFPLLLMKCCCSFVYTVLHATKDTLVVTTMGAGAETIPVLKGGVVLFFSFLFMLVYSKMSNHLNRARLFYSTLIPFILFFALYGFFLFPAREWLAFNESADKLATFLGVERLHWVAVYRYWMHSLFFLMAELWGGVVIALLFWSFANRINTLREASRFYTILSAGGHIGVIVSGPLIWYFASAHEFVHTIQSLMTIVAIAGLIIVGSYWWLSRNVIVETEVEKRKPATKLSLWDSLKHVVLHPSLCCIALMVIGYGLSVNMIEVMWKATLKLQYPNPKDYEAFMGLLASIIGVVAFLLAFLVSGNVIRKLGWYVAAQSTPVVLGAVSVLFLAVFFFFQTMHIPLAIGSSALLLLTIFGAIHNVSCKSMKYTLFDPTKEMAYIPLDEESKVKGKAAVDVVAARFGKSSASWIQVFFMELLGVGSVLSIAPYLAPCILVAVVGWLLAVRFLKVRSFGYSPLS